MEMDAKMKVPARAGASLRLCVPPEARFGRYVRERVVGFAAAQAVSEADAAEFVTAVSEALANALEHARSQEPIDVHCWLADGDQLLATVVDRGIGFEAEVGAAEPVLPDLLSERGRGLPIMQRYTDLFAVSSEPGKGTSVVLGRYVRRGGAPRAGGGTSVSG
jgi:anti-sigma regulatory factor (Ser/Thr protein kinase)